jgi:hypothetical protein
MTRQLTRLLTLVLVGAAGQARANEFVQKPEQLIPASVQVYARWDGVTAHREQYAQTAIGKLLGDDLAPLRRELLDLYPRLLRSELTEKKLLDGLPPGRLAAIHAAVAESGKLLDVLAQHGIVVAVEIGQPPSLWQMAVTAAQAAMKKGADPSALLPRVNVIVVVPEAAADFGVIRSTLLLMEADKTLEFNDETVARRKLTHAVKDGVHVAAWVEGKHVVINIGTVPPAEALARMESQEPRIDSHPLYKRLNADDFRTDLRAFADTKSLLGIAQRYAMLADPTIGRKLDALGLTGVHAILYRSGFDGPQMRELVEVDAPGPRQGLLRVVGGKPLTLDKLPALPPDVSRWSAHRFEPSSVYDVAMQLFEIAHPPDPEEKNPDTAAQRLDKAAGINLKEELLPYLGDTVVAFASPSEGLISFGQVFAVEVKDAERVQQALDQIVQTQAGGNVRLKKRPVGDGEVREIYIRKQGFFFAPSYTIYKGWLVAGLFPQPVQAFVQRAGAGAKAWEPDESVKSAFAALPKNAIGLAVADARPSVQQALTFAPIIIQAMQGFGNSGTFEVGTLPAASVVNQRLTPTVTAMTDDGTTLRLESRGSLPLPGDFLGIDPVLALISSTIFN